MLKHPGLKGLIWCITETMQTHINVRLYTVIPRSVTTTRRLRRFSPTSPRTSPASPPRSTTTSVRAASTWPGAERSRRPRNRQRKKSSTWTTGARLGTCRTVWPRPCTARSCSLVCCLWVVCRLFSFFFLPAPRWCNQCSEK